MPLTVSDKIFIKLKSAYLRLTLTKTTLAFFLFGFCHCFAQATINGFLFAVDDRYAFLSSGVVQAAQLPSKKEFAWLHDDGNGGRRLDLCIDIPLDLKDKKPDCETIYESKVGGITRGNVDGSVPVGYKRQEDRMAPAKVLPLDFLSSLEVVSISNSNTSTESVSLIYKDETGTIVKHNLNKQCTRVMLYPTQVLQNSKRESVTAVCFQFWLFAISFFSVMHDSIPHTITVLCARALVTGWSAFSIWRTTEIRRRFHDLFIDAGTACAVDFGFHEYFKERIRYEIPDLLLNVTALTISLYLSVTLLKMYKKQTFNCIGAPKHILRTYRFFMAILVCLQLGTFVIIAAMCLWIDQLFNSALAFISEHTPAHKAFFFFTTPMSVVWLVMGWYGVRREMKVVMALHLFFAFCFLAGWSVMFYSQVYRWTFLEWPFMACLTTMSFILMLVSIGLGVVCWLNFHKGLAHYLRVESKLASSDFEPEIFSSDVEKGSPEPLSHLPEHTVHIVPTLHSGDSFRTQVLGQKDGRISPDSIL